jgi:hypothetical protein
MNKSKAKRTQNTAMGNVKLVQDLLFNQVAYWKRLASLLT